MPSPEEADLILREYAQRTSEEIAASIGALRLAAGARRSRARWRLVAEALGRLEGLGRRHRLLAMPLRETVDASVGVEAVCRSIGGARPRAFRSVMELDLPSTYVPGVVARRLWLVAAELVAEAVGEALDDREGRLSVSLRSDCGAVALQVSDDRPLGGGRDPCEPLAQPPVLGFDPACIRRRGAAVGCAHASTSAVAFAAVLAVVVTVIVLATVGVGVAGPYVRARHARSDPCAGGDLAADDLQIVVLRLVSGGASGVP